MDRTGALAAIDDALRRVQGNVYPQRPLVQRMLAALSAQTQSLLPRVDNFVYNDGRVVLLVKLDGTVPITFRQRRYNIPVCIWIPEAFPGVPPICYVVPTPGMMIKPRHQHVDAAGMVYLPYLHSWSQSSSTLVDLVNQMSAIFSNEPPVFKAQIGPVHSAQAQPQQLLREPEQSTSDPRATDERSIAEARLTRKLRAALDDFVLEAGAQIDQLVSQQASLKKGSTLLDLGTSAMRDEQANLVAHYTTLQQASSHLQAWLSENEDKQVSMHVDQLVVPRDTHSAQMYDLVARDHAIEDTMYCLDRALQDGSITLEDFVKIIRKLAREQFFARALANKIEESQSLDTLPRIN